MSYLGVPVRRNGPVIGGVVTASLAAGPLFLLAVMLVAPDPTPFTTSEAGMIAALMMVAMIFGFLLSIVPIAVGTGIMVWSGNRNFAGQLAPIWTIAGAAMAGLPTWLCVGVLSDEMPLVAAMALCGAMCAWIVHAFTRWDGDNRGAVR